ncbi:hypothetical protein CAEBREN_01773 [Caenorhabditis brenneri]|uniref:Triacylglycerol lipase n=1 Tax=Caenorhabditis brenneri TaxID=135651 RepID=G0MCU1_CAEBE|nr:hypothetical protein CAEBREN_01773 [Caenorhabditis brenneri]
MAPLLLKLALLAVLTSTASGYFSTSFRTWISATYGESTAVTLERADLGAAGSFGGGTHNGLSATSKRPILIVHGITNTAGTFNNQRTYFVNNGWSDETVYATTYGDGGVTNVLGVDMECAFVQQVRTMLKIVNAFTQQKVDVIGYSLGSPIIRKAIMGGNCVDNGVALGDPLTSIVETFVSVAGANRGSSLCALPYLFVDVCNANNGLWCGSTFLSNINNPSNVHYEGSKVFSIYGFNDDKVGKDNLCFTGPNSRIPGYDAEMSNAQGNHDQILENYVNVTKVLLDTGAFPV